MLFSRHTRRREFITLLGVNLLVWKWPPGGVPSAKIKPRREVGAKVP
jgi:hypothetical protein